MENVVSGFVLRRFCDLVADGVKTDQGFKEVHLNLVARDLKEFTGQDVTGTQVYNHLRKWRARWVKICRLKDLSGAGWDEDKFMITLSPDHYYAYTKHHPKDTQFLNQPLLNYIQMQTIFASGVAIRRFNMGSNEPLGTQPQGDPIDLEIEFPSNATAHGAVGGRGTWAAGGAATWAAGAVGTSALGATSNYVAGVAAGGATGIEAVAGKRKRSCHDEALMIKLVDTIWGFAPAVTELTRSEVAPGMYQSAMACSRFSKEALMFALGHLMDHKATTLKFIQMDEDDKDLWLRTYLNQHYY